MFPKETIYYTYIIWHSFSIYSIFSITRIDDLTKVIINYNSFTFADEAKLIKIIKTKQDEIYLLFIHVPLLSRVGNQLIKVTKSLSLAELNNSLELYWNHSLIFCIQFVLGLSLHFFPQIIKIKLIKFLNFSLWKDWHYKRHKFLHSKCLHKLILGDIEFPEILSLVRFRTNCFNTRNSKPFYSFSSNKNYILNFPAYLLIGADKNFIYDYL
jgi:hypothetical protein